MTSDQPGPPTEGLLLDDEREQAIAALVEPGLQANAWRPDYERLRRRRLWNELYHDERVRLLQTAFPDLHDRRILDVGAGRGGLTVALRRRGHRIFGLDLRRRNCRVTRLRSQRYGMETGVVQARAEHLPIADGAIDLVICRDVLEHVGGANETLREVHRILRPNGSCFITVINRLCWTDPHYHLAGLAFLPRRLAERYIAWRGRAKISGRDRQQISDMNYYTYLGFAYRAQRLGFAVDDANGSGSTRMLSSRALLRSFSLASGHFEFLLRKVSRA